MERTHPNLSLERLKQGDRHEFARLVEYYTDPVFRIASNIVTTPQDAEDVLQETFIKVLKNIKDFEERSSLSTWIYRITVNEALMLVRKHRKPVTSIEENGDHEDHDKEPLEIVDWKPLPEMEFQTRELRAEMENAVRALPEKLRVVFLLRDIEELSIRATAEALNITEMAVKTRLLRARLQLRQQLSHYFTGRLEEKVS
jgi:RNA polymerase sigma-70 factor (ECF subfamily)